MYSTSLERTETGALGRTATPSSIAAMKRLRRPTNTSRGIFTLPILEPSRPTRKRWLLQRADFMQFGYFFGAVAQNPRQHLVGVLAEQGRGPFDPAGRARHPPRRPGMPADADLGMVEFDKKVAFLEMRILEEVLVGRGDGRGNTGFLQCLFGLARVTLRGPLGDECLEFILVMLAGRKGREARVRAQFR